MTNTYYKYRPLYQECSCGAKKPNPFTQSIFEKAEMWYATPNSFNDPYDCNLKLHVEDSTDEEWSEYCDRMALDYPAKRGQMEHVKANRLWRTEPALSAGVGDSTRKSHYLESSVLCLARSGNSIHMFSHYADTHKGIAIEFEFSDKEMPCGIEFSSLSSRAVPYEGKVIFGEVDYPAIFPELNYHRLYDDHKMIRSLIFTKHREWEHENEFRIFRRRVPASLAKFPKSLIKRVILGCRTTADDLALVKSWLVGWPTKVVLAKVKEADDRFELQIEDLEEVGGV